LDIEFVGNFLQNKYTKIPKIKSKIIFIFVKFLSTNSDFKYLKIKMTLDLVPELCSVKGVVVISQTKSECILKIPRDFVFETLESINKLVDIEDFEISNLSLEEIILQNYFTKKEHN